MKASDIRKALLDAQIDVPSEEVPVPEAWRPILGDTRLFMRGFTASEWEAYVTSLTSENGQPTNSSVRLLVALLTDEDGERIFQGNDVKALASHPGSVVTELQEAALRISGLTKSQDFVSAQSATTFTE